MNLSKIDLNLFLVFDAIVQTVLHLENLDDSAALAKLLTAQ